MLPQDQILPFELLEDGQWGYFILFPEFKPYNVSALKEFESRHGGSNTANANATAPVPSTAPPGREQNQLMVSPEDVDDEDDDYDDDEDGYNEVAEINEHFEQGRFKVVAGIDYPTPNQVRGAIFLDQRKQQIFRILIDHIYSHYTENRDAFRDFFNGEPEDRELLFPQLTSPFGLMRLIRLMVIEVRERAHNGKSFITFYFDTTWQKEDIWEVTICGEQIVSPDLPLLPIQLAAGSGWQQLRASGKGWRFAEFAYGGAWTGIYRIDANGICVSHTECPVCAGPQILDATMITAIREAPRAHMLASLVHMLALKPWIQNGLKIVGPISYLLGWTWNPMFYWVTLVVSGLAGMTAYLDAGWRRTGWVWIAMLEVALAWLALMPNRSAPALDTEPSWTVLGIFSQFVWTTTAAITVTWFYFLIGMAKHPLLRRAIWHLATFGILQVVALTVVARSEYSPLHLLWFTPLTLLGTVLIAGRHLYASFQQQIRDSMDQGPLGGDPGMNWQQILDQISKGNRSNSVFESRPEKKDDPVSE